MTKTSRIYPKRVYSKDEVDEKLKEQKKQLRTKIIKELNRMIENNESNYEGVLELFKTPKEGKKNE